MFSKKLKILRKERGLTQVQLADIIEMSQVQIANYENGKIRPTLKTLKKIEKKLGLSKDYFENPFVLNISEINLDEDYNRLKKVVTTDEDKLFVSKLMKSLYYTLSSKELIG